MAIKLKLFYQQREITNKVKQISGHYSKGLKIFTLKEEQGNKGAM